MQSLVRAGVDVIQLRDKQLADRYLLERARRLRELTRGSPTLFMMNDRPDLAHLAEADGVHVGNFCEVKNSNVGQGSKINHLSYVGDTDVGNGVNVGAGTITCNYDGANKHRTNIGDGAFIGSGSMLVAPVSVGEQATIGAGSTITKDAPAGKLTLERSKQVSLDGWKRPVKK